MAEEALNICPDLIELFCATQYWYDRYEDLLPGDEDKTYRLLEEDKIEELSSVDHPQGVLLVMKKGPLNHIDTHDQSLFIFLDAVQDPGNVGTMIRTADWFGHKKVYYGPGTVDPYNSKVVQASMGSLFRVEPVYVSRDDLNKEYLNMTWTAASKEGMNLSDWKVEDPELLIIGNEGAGVSERLLSVADRGVSIPGSPKANRAESLNAAVACGILLSHWMEKSKGKTSGSID